jgi:hypothetical protein
MRPHVNICINNTISSEYLYYLPPNLAATKKTPCSRLALSKKIIWTPTLATQNANLQTVTVLGLWRHSTEANSVANMQKWFPNCAKKSVIKIWSRSILGVAIIACWWSTNCIHVNWRSCREKFRTRLCWKESTSWTIFWIEESWLRAGTLHNNSSTHLVMESNPKRLLRICKKHMYRWSNSKLEYYCFIAVIVC